MLQFGSAPDWKLADGFYSGDRIAPDPTISFPAIVDLIAKEMTGAAGKIEPHRACANRWRPIFRFKVSKGTFDAFYNGASGYRAQYLIHPELGQAANGFVIAALAGRLLPALESSEHSQEEAATSLAANSAKIWPHEDQIIGSRLVGLAVDRWVRAASDDRLDQPYPLRTPEGRQLEVKGAWLDASGCEFVSPGKVRRRFQIHETGFS